MPLLRKSLLFLLLTVWLAAALAADADKFFDPNLGDFADELKTARQSGKHGVLLMFEMDGCPYCRRMREQILSSDDVQAYFHRHFAVFSVDTRGSQPLTDFKGRQTTESGYTRAMGVQGTPTFIVFGVDGRELVRMNGAAKDAEEFMQFGRYIVSGRYESVSPERFYPPARSWQKP